MRRIIATVGGLALGLCFSQFPEYAQQYEQRLGGAVDELRAITTEFDSASQQAGLTREQAFSRYEAAPDGFLAGRGLSMQAIFARYDELQTDLADLQGASPLQRLEHLGQYLDSGVGARALQNYKPAVPVTPEGLAWGLAGLVLGYFGLYPLLGFLTLPFRWRRGQSPHRKAFRRA
ncbi:MAG: DUF2937 family protein [Devosia sp.]